MGKLIPAKYIADYEIVLSKFGAPYIDASGKPLTSLTLHKGDVIHMDEHEVSGFTVILDPRAEKEPQYIGPGRAILDEHKGKSPEQLAALNYQFHEGRRDFEPYIPKPVLKKDDVK